MKENPSVIRILNILDLVAKHDEGITLGDIYRTLGISKSTAHNILQTLYKMDAVYYKDPRIKSYVIGSKMFAIGSIYTRNSNIIERSENELKSFADQFHRVVVITKKIEDKIIYVYKYQPRTATLNFQDGVGTIKPYDLKHVMSKVYRAYDVPFRSEQHPVLRSYDEETKIETLVSPLLNFEQKVVGAIATFDLLMDTEHKPEISVSFQSIARLVSKRLGYIEN